MTFETYPVVPRPARLNIQYIYDLAGDRLRGDTHLLSPFTMAPNSASNQGDAPRCCLEVSN